jgi:hypothetical protein
MNLVDRYPRGSAFYIYSNCDISFELMQKAGEEPATSYAFKGTRGHAALAGRLAPSALEADEKTTYDTLVERYDASVRTWLGDEPAPHTQLVEHRMWMRAGLRPIYSGQPDKVLIVRERAFLPDFKTGWHPLDAITATNCQLRAYVPLVHQEVEGIEEITARILKPGKLSPAAVFDKEAIREATVWALEVVGRITTPAPKKPNRGPWCEYCSGKVLCPLWKDELHQLATYNKTIFTEATDQVLREIGPKLDIAAKVIERLKLRLEKRVLEDPALFPDWRMEPGEKRRRIVNLIKAYAALNSVGVTPHEFLAGCSGNVGELETTFRKKKGLKTIDASREFNKLLADALEVRPNKDKLVYIPAAVETEGDSAHQKLNYPVTRPDGSLEPRYPVDTGLHEELGFSQQTPAVNQPADLPFQ